MDDESFTQVIEEGRALQERFPEVDGVAVGGTAAALHCGHRFSLDVDIVTPRVETGYFEIAEALEKWKGWKTNRKNAPVLILGERIGVELALREQRRALPVRRPT